MASGSEDEIIGDGEGSYYSVSFFYLLLMRSVSSSLNLHHVSKRVYVCAQKRLLVGGARLDFAILFLAHCES